MSNKKKFIEMALKETKPFSSLCEDFNISRACGYKWLKRYQEQGLNGLVEKSRRPHQSPYRTPDELEKCILEVRNQYQVWGARKIYAYLQAQGISKLPNPSTITRILHRHSKISPETSIKHQPFKRFGHELPNQLWQMDFKGHFPIAQKRCYPLTVLDDHSRYSLGIRACRNETTLTVKDELVTIFRKYGLPERMTMDNGSPWGNSTGKGYSSLEIWLIRLGIYVSHSRPCHPQTQGKDERFHRTMKEELLNLVAFINHEDAQKQFDKWRDCYNHRRPHEALGMKAPVSRYQISPRRYPENLPYLEYNEGSIVKRVNNKGYIKYGKDDFYITDCAKGLHVKIEESHREGILEVYLAHQKLKEIDLKNKIVAKRIA